MWFSINVSIFKLKYKVDSNGSPSITTKQLSFDASRYILYEFQCNILSPLNNITISTNI